MVKQAEAHLFKTPENRYEEVCISILRENKKVIPYKQAQNKLLVSKRLTKRSQHIQYTVMEYSTEI
jgi:hypothetical protein